ncbi:MAG: tetratricopeptide repeat protein [Akkermansiaceae bacterium]
MSHFNPLALLLALILPLAADEAASLEARLKETAEASPAGAKLMLELIDQYESDGQVFGLIRTASKFARIQTEHPKRPDVTNTLIKGYAAAARHDDVITTGKQFLEIFPDHGLSAEVRNSLAIAYEQTERNAQAAQQRAEIFRIGGSTKQAIAAIQIWKSANKKESFEKATDLALALTKKTPVDSIAVAAGFQGMEAALRCEKWKEGLSMANNLRRSNIKLESGEKTYLSYLEGRFQSQLGQYANAIGSYRESLSENQPDRHRQLIRAMISAKSPISDIEKEARSYASKFPKREDRFEPLAEVAFAAADSNNLSKARLISAEVIKSDAKVRDITRALVGWHGDKPDGAARDLLAAMTSNRAHTGTLRAILALEVYRDRKKDLGKARTAAFEFLEKSPTEDGWTEEIVKFLYQSSENENDFKKALSSVEKSSRRYPHLAEVQARLWKPAPTQKAFNRQWQQTKKKHQSDPVARLWRQTRDKGGKSGQACKELLNKKWPEEIRHHLLSRLAYVYRHHLGGKSKEVSSQHYRELCKQFPTDLEAAARWLESSDYSDREMKIEAATHLLSIQADEVHPDVWLKLCEIKDESLVKKSLSWITASSKRSENPLTHSTRIGDIVNELGMKDEALAWWQSRMDVDLENRESINCALRVARSMESTAARSFLAKRYVNITAYQGIYASEIASLDFKSGNWEGMEKILIDTKARAEKNPFTRWGFGEWPSRSWLEATRKSTKMDDATKSRICKMIRKLEIGRLSAEAGMILLAEQERNLSRLLKAQELIQLCDNHHESWERIYPFAQVAMAKEDQALAAAILNGLLGSVRSVGQDQMTSARNLLRKAYGEMGGLTADIPPDSPIAPLLQIVLHLRLGETDLAEEAYYKNQQLFDNNRKDLPVELLLFASRIHIDQGTTEDHQRAEEILRGWLMKNSESETIDSRDKARIQLLLARNYQRASQFDIARAEFTTVLNLHKDQPEAIEARFGIGETYMAQKIYDQAGELFTELSQSPTSIVALRANFLLGVLALRQENNEEARQIFLSVLENAPDSELANETLFNLAEVYGIEQRYLTQLETLRTVGRLGQESKIWQTPGNALPIVVQDPDLGISRGNTRIPVVVRTDPGNDEEHSFLSSGGAGKGIFLSEIPTILGVAKPGDGVLQVTGGDTIVVDYPEKFKQQFQFEFLGNTRLRIASDGNLEVASSEIINQTEENFTQELKDEVEEKQKEKPRSAMRPNDQVKPGNLIYIQVKDGDRDRTPEPDSIPIRLTASSGDEVLYQISEEDIHGGIFKGSIRTGELPAGAHASDTAIDYSPLMAIDHDPASSWRSQPDGVAPKSLGIDMKELRSIDTLTLTTPGTEDRVPVRMRVRGSHDGRFWFELAEFPAPEKPQIIDFSEPGMQLRVYRIPDGKLRENYAWKDVVEIASKFEPTEKLPVDTLSWSPAEEDEASYFLIWSGELAQERDGAMRFALSGHTTALMLDGKLLIEPRAGEQQGDAFVHRGIHGLTAFSISTAKQRNAKILRARENPNHASVSLKGFKEADFDIAAIPGLKKAKAEPDPVFENKENHWTLRIAPQKLRHIEYEFLEYRGESIAVSNVSITGEGNQFVPPEQDVLELAGNDVLEIAPGDTVEVSYLDELTAGGIRPNRLLTQSLKATYYNGEILPIAFDFARDGSGSVSGSRKELLRIEPGERIVAEVADFDMDVGLERDSFEIFIQKNGETPLTYLATETGPSTGIFQSEIETSTDPEDGKLEVAAGDKIYLRYEDKQNTFPGHAAMRESTVFVNTPTNGFVRILESETPVEGSPRILADLPEVSTERERKIDYHLPLTVEVIDPDRAKDSNSTVPVEITTSEGTKVEIICKLSRAFAAPDEALDETRNPALFEGRFVGQIPLLLGKDTALSVVPQEGIEKTESVIGEIAGEDLESTDGRLVLNTLGNGTFTATYLDESASESRASKASLATAATLAITESEYLEPIEIARVGTKLYISLQDPDLDISEGRDKALVRILTTSGEDETVELEETLSHSGIFNSSFDLVATKSPISGNFDGSSIECFFGDELTVGYLDNVPQTPDGLNIIEVRIPIAIGTDGELAAFSKVFKDDELAIQTRFHIAESHFELFKGHRKLDQQEQANIDLEAGRRVLRQLQDEYPNPKYAPRIAYLLGQFAQEMEAWDEAIAAYGSIVRNFPESPLAPDSQYKLGQCHEEAGQLDEALEEYVTLAATYPKSPLVANVMLRINEHFYIKEEYAVAASVGEKFVERFVNHEWAPKMAFRIGQCHFKQEQFGKAGEAFDAFVKRYPEHELTAQALFWAGESYRMSNSIPNAFRRYNRCRWDFPETDAAKYSRGRLALPELLAQFEREANLD